MKHIFSLLFILLFACTQPTANETTNEQFSIDYEAISDLIMERMDLGEGENVLLVASPSFHAEFVTELSARIENSPGNYLGAMSITEEQLESWSTDFTESAKDLSDDELREYLKQVDMGIMLPGANPSHLAYGLIQDNLNDGIGRTIHFHWAGAYDLNGNELEVTEEIDQFYQDVLLTTDYSKLAADQSRFEEALRGSIVNVTTQEGTDISFEIGDRPVTKQSGDASAANAENARNLIDREMELPSGAIRVAPMEETVNGKIAFPDAKWSDFIVTGLVLTFEQGKVVDMTAESGLDAVQYVMDQAGESARSFREFALGLNPSLAIPEENPWIPYYGYGAGVVRLSLGDNTELGGNVEGGFVRWNFFTNATVKVGDEVWVENGTLIK